MRRPACFVLIAAITAGCALGPDYERPAVETPEAFRFEIDDGASIANIEWWNFFGDEQLIRLIAIALDENRDLRAAVARIDEARARLGFVRADQFPRIDAGAEAGRGNTAEAVVPGAGINERYVLAADLSFEVDIWGKLRRSTEAARAELLATEEARRTVIITLISDVASAYLLLLDQDQQREIAKRTLESRQESLEIIKARFEQGTVPLLDVNQAEIEAADAAAELARRERQVAETENLLSVLLGRNPGPIRRGKPTSTQVAFSVIPAGLPSELLERRPDVRAAEQRLHAQTARIGVAEALRWPSLNLTGTLGLVNDDLSDLLDSDSKLWDVGATLNGPVWDTFKSKRRVEVEKARTEQLLNAYEQAILQAFREVEDSLTGISTYRAESLARERQAEAARSAAKLSRARYDGGVTSYLEVLDSERSLFQAELQASSTRRELLVSIIELYKALGGGWESEALREAEQDAQREAAAAGD